MFKMTQQINICIGINSSEQNNYQQVKTRPDQKTKSINQKLIFKNSKYKKQHKELFLSKQPPKNALFTPQQIKKRFD
jgi:hypothetical protein